MRWRLFFVLLVLLTSCAKRKKGAAYRAVALELAPSTLCARMHDGTYRCSGRLGDRTVLRPELFPSDLARLAWATQTHAPTRPQCLVDSEGAARCTRENALAIVHLPGPAAEVTTGSDTACFRLRDETVACGKTDGEPLRSFEGLNGVTRVSLGSHHGCALRGDQTVLCWGRGLEGQLGGGDASLVAERPKPAIVPGLYEATDIACAGNFSCAIMKDGWVRCWGENADGQLGDGTTTRRTVPQPVKF